MKQPSVLVVAAALLLGSLATPARAATTVLHNFIGGNTDGTNPSSSLTLSGSTLYGVTAGGGIHNNGVAFSLNTDGTGYRLLRHFFNWPTDGGNPVGSLTLSGSKFYGMTGTGGSSGHGTVYSMNTDGTGFTLLHSFTGGTTDGYNPAGSLTLSGTKLYGMTREGGSHFEGTLFSINTDGTGFSLLHAFTGGATDGQYPQGSLTLSGSKLYGLTFNGGSSDNGTLFSTNTDGSNFNLLHTFTGSTSDGAEPFDSLTLSGSKLYGLTSTGGSHGTGTLFSINTDGTGFGLLHSFAGGASDGQGPPGSLALSGSRLYGTTTQGGANALGTLFSINTDGTGFTLLESFSGYFDGAYPGRGAPTFSEDGSTLYATTGFGGTASSGVVFSRAIPEPGGFTLLGLGALLFSARRRRDTF